MREPKEIGGKEGEGLISQEGKEGGGGSEAWEGRQMKHDTF